MSAGQACQICGATVFGESLNRNLHHYVWYMADPIRFEVTTRAGLRGTTAGGSWVEESSRNRAVLEALASVLNTDSTQLQVVAGANERTKLIEWADPPPDALDRIENWRKTRP